MATLHAMLRLQHSINIALHRKRSTYTTTPSFNLCQCTDAATHRLQPPKHPSVSPNVSASPEVDGSQHPRRGPSCRRGHVADTAVPGVQIVTSSSHHNTTQHNQHSNTAVPSIPHHPARITIPDPHHMATRHPMLRLEHSTNIALH